jgi:hypothetical protein
VRLRVLYPITFYHILLHSTTFYYILLHSTTFYHILPHLSESYHKRTWLATFTTQFLLSVQWASSEKATAAFEFRMWMHIVEHLVFGLSRSNPICDALILRSSRTTLWWHVVNYCLMRGVPGALGVEPRSAKTPGEREKHPLGCSLCQGWNTLSWNKCTRVILCWSVLASTVLSELLFCFADN